MPGTPRETSPSFIRVPIVNWKASGGASGLAPDFGANTLQTIFGGATGFVAGFWYYVERLRLVIGNADFAGAGGTLTFELRRDSATGPAVAQLVIPLANALRGSILDATVTPASDAAARISPTTPLFLVRLATGTVFTSGEGTWSIVARQKLQSRGA